MHDAGPMEREWMPRLFALADRIRAALRGPLRDAARAGALGPLAAQRGQGAGDVTFAIDVLAEDALARWIDETAPVSPLSVLSEDHGWRHAGARADAGFDHGGPRISVDPIDGTRNLMNDLRSAWCVIGLAGPGAGPPRLRDLQLGVVAELPDSRGALARELYAARGRGARARLVPIDGDLAPIADRELACDQDDRPDHGYFPFFRYLPEERPAIARVEAEFFARLAREERADVRNCYDDQLIANGGQLALLALGTYRMVADLRAHLANRDGRKTLSGKPYDSCGAILVAEEAGCVVRGPGGEPLDFEIDTSTPVSFVGWHNAQTRARLERHLLSVLAR